MIHINDKLISEISSQAKQSPRKRKNYNFHKEESDLLQRMLNAMEPNTYIAPHKHEKPDKREVFFVLKGSILLVEYNDNGEIVDHSVLNPNIGNYAAEIPAGVWHSLICLEASSVSYEFKDGPYNPNDDKIFASWAPKEGDTNGMEFNKEILKKLNISPK